MNSSVFLFGAGMIHHFSDDSVHSYLSSIFAISIVPINRMLQKGHLPSFLNVRSEPLNYNVDRAAISISRALTRLAGL